MKKLALEIVALSHSVTQSHNYAVVLGEIEGNRRLPIVIGSFEAQAIAVSMEGMTPNRPLTHDLFKNTLDLYSINLREIVINNLLDGIFYAKLICDKEGEIIEIDSRTSDALALAVRFNCPIYTFDFILDSAGIILEDTGESTPTKEQSPKDKQPKSLSSLSLDKLTNMLEEVLADEDYEKAAEIRDELNRRKENQ
jgi:bifunctional DNase/RNase